LQAQNLCNQSILTNTEPFYLDRFYILTRADSRLEPHC